MLCTLVSKRKKDLNICNLFIYAFLSRRDLNVVFQLDEYFKQKSFDRVQLWVGACCVRVQWFGGARARSTLAAERPGREWPPSS